MLGSTGEVELRSTIDIPPSRVLSSSGRCLSPSSNTIPPYMRCRRARDSVHLELSVKHSHSYSHLSPSHTSLTHFALPRYCSFTNNRHANPGHHTRAPRRRPLQIRRCQTLHSPVSGSLTLARPLSQRHQHARVGPPPSRQRRDSPAEPLEDTCAQLRGRPVGGVEPSRDRRCSF